MSYLKKLEDKLNKIEIQFNELYYKSDNEYKQKTTNLKKSITQKFNWIKYRTKYQRGIKKSNFLNPYKDIRKSFLNNIK